MNRESFYGRFSTSARSASTEHEGFGDRFSTSKARHGKNLQVIGGSREVLIMVVVALDLVFGVLRPFVAEPMHVPSESMSPTLQVRDRVLTNKLAYDLLDPERGDLAVFENVETNNDEDVVKRVVGLPGDEVALKNGVLLINGEEQDEPYLANQELPQNSLNRDSFDPVITPQNHLFVLGDNRANSYDSRFFGPVPTENLLGEVSLRFWPLNRLGFP